MELLVVITDLNPTNQAAVATGSEPQGVVGDALSIENGSRLEAEWIHTGCTAGELGSWHC